ncbi:MAG: hypothetical protein WCO23_00410 [bacterium]
MKLIKKELQAHKTTGLLRVLVLVVLEVIACVILITIIILLGLISWAGSCQGEFTGCTSIAVLMVTLFAVVAIIALFIWLIVKLFRNKK